MTTLEPADLLRASINLAGAAVADAAEVPQDLPTPCHRWPLGVLVRHLADSAGALGELLTDHPPGPPPLPGCSSAQAAIAGLEETVATLRRDPTRDLTVLVGSYELTLHAWDVNQATGSPTSAPPPLVAALLGRAPLVVPWGSRAGLFGPALVPRPTGGDLDRLLALFGRSVNWRDQ